MKKIHKNKLLTFALFIIVVLLISCALRTNRWGLPQYEYTYRVPDEIDDGWKTASLSDENVDPQKINELMQDILLRRYKNIHSVLLVKNGKLVLEEYFHGYDRETMHELHSVSKSITSILVGIAVDKKMIPNVDKKVYEFFIYV